MAGLEYCLLCEQGQEEELSNTGVSFSWTCERCGYGNVCERPAPKVKDDPLDGEPTFGYWPRD